MSERLGPMTFGRKEEQPFLGRDLAYQPDYSGDTAIKIDGEVKRIVERNYRRAKDLLSTNRDCWSELRQPSWSARFWTRKK